MKNKIFAACIPAALLLCLQTNAQVKNNTITIGEKQEIQSSVLAETRNISAYAPDNQSQKLPLIIVFDGENLFTTVVSAARFMHYSSEIPQIPDAVVVGVVNTQRSRDMPVPQQFGLNGEDNFRKFLVEELIPYCKNKYPLNGHVIVIGHSQGGLFVSYLLSKSPELFPWVVALDAPMAVDSHTNGITNALSKILGDQSRKERYVSVEALYGWGSSWPNLVSANGNARQIKLSDESHESMPFKGIYDGLKYLYRDFSPPRPDLSLPELLSFYQSVSTKYGYLYEVPLRILLASAGRKLLENRKAQINELLDYAETKYGKSEQTKRIRNEAAKLSGDSDTLIDHYLKLPKPTAEEIKNYVGRWVGTLVVRDGQNMPVDMEIVIENGRGKMLDVLPWPPYKKEEREILAVSGDGKLIFGRRNRGGGLVISTAVIDQKGKLTGHASLIGFVIQDDFPDDVKKQMKFIIENPNTFSLERK